MKVSVLTLVTCAISFFLNSITFAQAPNFEWAKSAGGSSVERGSSICTDPSGNVYVTGIIELGSAVFGTTTINEGMFLVKYDPNGNVLWVKNVLNAIPTKICTDLIGNVVITGYFKSTVSFGAATIVNTSTVVGGNDMFIAKYDPLGNPIWAKGAIGANNEYSKSVATDSYGNIFITGTYFNSITIGSTSLLSSSYSPAFVAKYDPLGNEIWVKNIGGSGRDTPNDMIVDSAGNVLVVGSFSNPLFVFASATFTNSTGTDNCFIIKFDKFGNEIWANVFGDHIGNDIFTSISSDSNGNIYVSGQASQAISIGISTLTVTSGGQTFLTKFDFSGNIIWAKNLGASHNVFIPYSIFSDKMGNVFLAGKFSGSSTGYISASSVSLEDAYIMKHDVNGNFIWVKSVGGYYNENCVSITGDEIGNIYLTGHFNSSNVIFGLDTLINIHPTFPGDDFNGGQDMFIAKLSSSLSSLNDVKESSIVTIYPNPSNGIYYLNANDISSKTKDLKIEVVNTIGQNVFESNSMDLKKIEINLSQYPSGTYFVKIYNEEIISTKKIIKL